MINVKDTSTIRLVTKGYLFVNIPVVLTILTVWLGFYLVLDVPHVIAILAGSLAGWYLWTFLIKKWIRWAIANNVSKDKILRVGRLSLLLWNKSTLNNALAEEEKD